MSRWCNVCRNDSPHTPLSYHKPPLIFMQARVPSTTEDVRSLHHRLNTEITRITLRRRLKRAIERVLLDFIESPSNMSYDFLSTNSTVDLTASIISYDWPIYFRPTQGYIINKTTDIVVEVKYLCLKCMYED